MRKPIVTCDFAGGGGPGNSPHPLDLSMCVCLLLVWWCCTLYYFLFSLTIISLRQGSVVSLLLVFMLHAFLYIYLWASTMYRLASQKVQGTSKLMQNYLFLDARYSDQM